MPYIPRNERPTIRATPIGQFEAKSPAELAYAVYVLCTNSIGTAEVRWNDLADVIKVLECCKLEFYDRKIRAHEDKAIERNGDI